MEHEVEEEPLKDVAEHLPAVPVAPAHGIASIALSMAMKYHDINTIQEGALYQQYKLEGKNIHGLHLDMVRETAEKLEMWLMASSKRIAAIIVDALAVAVDKDEPTPAEEAVVVENKEDT